MLDPYERETGRGRNTYIVATPFIFYRYAPSPSIGFGSCGELLITVIQALIALCRSWCHSKPENAKEMNGQSDYLECCTPTFDGPAGGPKINWSSKSFGRYM